MSTEVGTLRYGASGAASIDQATRVRKDVWRLDLLGNWVGVGAVGNDPGGPGRQVVAGPSAAPSGEWLDGGQHTAKSDQVDARNALMDVALAGPSGGVEVRPRYDAAGNLSFDGQYFYQYDAWNRLVQVNRGHEGPPPPPPPQTGGEPTGDPDEQVPGAPIIIDQLVKHWTYDGLGRLVRTQSPWPDPDIGVATGLLRSERFYYDGIRRVQEVVTDPVASQGVIQGVGGGTPGAGPGDPEADPTAATITSEQGQINGAQGGSPPTALPQTVTTLVREYVWGPGDGPGGVDELLVQYATDRVKPWWVLQDGGGDVAALCETPLPGAQAVVAGQWTYDAYGSCLTAEHLRAYPLLHCGHKALFFDRLDVGVVGSSGDEIARLVPYAHAVYQVRNRAYAPALGRFYQRDPNETSLALVSSLPHHGATFGASVGATDMESLYGDGANLHQYLRSGPWDRSDPLGLSDQWDPLNFDPRHTPLPFDPFAAGDIGGLISAMLESLVTQYAGRQESDLDWASDWDAGDNMHSRLDSTWVQLALIDGVREHFGVDPVSADEDDESDENADGPAMALGPARVARTGGRGMSRLVGVSRQVYNIRRAEFKQGRMRHWRTEIRANPARYSAAQKTRVLRADKPPIGKDGYSMEIHHKQMLSRGGTNETSNLKFMNRSDHRLGPNNRRNHPPLRRRGRRWHGKRHRRRTGAAQATPLRHGPSRRHRRGHPPRLRHAESEAAP